MTETLVNNLWLVPALPLLAALVTALFGKGWGRLAALPAVLGIGASAVISLLVLVDFRPADGPTLQATRVMYEWIRAGDFVVPIEFRADALSIAMISMVTSVATLITIFAAGYMAHDAAKPRFFAIVALFVFCMTGLVLSNNFALTYAFWEGVGVCSYLLVGHYYFKASAGDAARKAFLVNRVGDVGFALAIFGMWSTVGSLSYDDVLGTGNLAAIGTGTATLWALLLFWAATAKSAQVPLYTWLPDAMEGPTPVSALIHAATMVTAGVYLVARAYPLFQLSPAALMVVAIVGGVTALLAALIAITQHDLKRVLAYSTVSQLGFMVMALGAGVGGVARLAVTAAIFHLLTHAFFKALLFLGSGSVMHAMGDVIDMRRFGGLLRRMPITAITFGIGALALAGLPPLSGFFSKDEILIALDRASHEASFGGWVYATLYWGALFTALLTAYYITRAFCLTFLGPFKLPSADDPEATPEERSHDHQDHHHHHGDLGRESPPLMTIPLIFLAGAAAVAGGLLAYDHLFAHYLEGAPDVHALATGEAHGEATTTMILGGVASVLGILIGFVLHGRGRDLKQPQRGPWRGFLVLSQRKFFVDEAYGAFLVKPAEVVAKLSYIVDVILIEPLTRALALAPRLMARAGLAPAQNGLIQSYAAFSALAIAALLVYFLLR